MKVERIPKPPGIATMTLNELAEKYDLTLLIQERTKDDLISAYGKYYVSFQSVENMRNGMLEGITGNGDTEEEATINYAQKISNKKLVIYANDFKRRTEFKTGILTFEKF